MEKMTKSEEISRWQIENGHPELQNLRRNPAKPHISWDPEEGWCYELNFFATFEEENDLIEYCVEQHKRWCPV